MATSAAVTAVTVSVLWLRPAAAINEAEIQRLPALARLSDNTIDDVVKESMWTQYGDYGTVRMDRIERPARLLTGNAHFVREVTVAATGARYEAYVGAIGAPAKVRIGRAGGMRSETAVGVNRWTSVVLELDASHGRTQFIEVDIDVARGGVAAWGSELIAPLHRGDGPSDVILISLDTVRRDQLTPYDPSLPTTPSLAAFAWDALRFDQAISTSSWTVGSHAALFTGQFPADSLGYQSRIERDEQTLAEIFAGNGYRTFAVSGGPYTDPRWGLHQGFDEFVVSGERENASDATSRAIEWLVGSGSTPVFLFLNYFNAHEPLELSRDVRLATGVREDVPLSMWSDLDEGRIPVTPDVRQRLLRAYRAQLTAIDTELGRLFQHLRRTNRWDGTLVIVWSDHGQLLGERTHLGHALSLEEELIRVPLIIKPPKGSSLNPGLYRGLIQNDDLFLLTQTLAGLDNREGEEIRKALSTNTPIRRWAFSKIHHDPLPALTSVRRWRSATQWAVRNESMKIVADLEGNLFAYDLTGSEERATEVPGPGSPIVTALERFRVWSRRATPARTVGPLSPAEIERLRSLGYVQ
jgi:arylsulfatase A-like enzyme